MGGVPKYKLGVGPESESEEDEGGLVGGWVDLGLKGAVSPEGRGEGCRWDTASVKSREREGVELVGAHRNLKGMGGGGETEGRRWVMGRRRRGGYLGMVNRKWCAGSGVKTGLLLFACLMTVRSCIRLELTIV